MNIKFKVNTLGKNTIKSPISLGYDKGDGIYNYVKEDERIIYARSLESFTKHNEEGTIPVSFEKAGPREFIFFEPANTKVGIVTCGGLCPGLNNVIRSIVMESYYRYGVEKIIGFQFGFEGLIPSYKHPYIELNPEFVDDIHLQGGSILGSSRGSGYKRNSQHA